MNKASSHCKFNRTLFILVILDLASKLVLLNFNEAETTDSVFYLTISQIGKSKWMPVYPVLVQFTYLFLRDLLFSGRLTAIIMSALSIFPFYAITKRLYNEKAALYATALYIVSPLIMRWSIRVMTESSFMFFLLLSLWCLTKWFDNRKSIYGLGIMAFSGIAALARPEGIGLLPIVLAFVIYALYKQKVRAVYWIIIGLIPWFFQIFWHWKVVGKYGYGQELHRGIERATFLKCFSYIFLYIANLPYIITPVIFFFAIYGVYKSVRSRSEDSIRKIYHLFALYLLVAWLLTLSFHLAWITRFMFPIVALCLIFSGYGISCIRSIRSKTAAFIICMATSIVFTVFVLIGSRAFFGDVRKASYFVRDNVPSDAMVVSREITKTRFWSERDMGRYNRKNLKPGTYVVLQSFYCNLEWEMNYLKEHYDIEVVYRKAGTLVPILADVAYLKPTKRKDGTIALLGGVNRLSKQRFESAVIYIKKTG